MRNSIIYGIIIAIFAVGVASGATVFASRSAGGDDFCAGYAICLH